jgi:mRNA-degrading endonuclease RelE of RelBE toxin-antitoxin system
MIEIEFSEKFSKIFFKIKDELFKVKLKKQIRKIASNPKIGKPMRNIRKGTREVYMKPYRLSYEYFEKDNVIFILDLYHKKFQ